MTGPDVLVGENAVLSGHKLDYTMIAAPNLVAWRYPAHDVRKTWPHDTITHLLDDCDKKYCKILASEKTVNNVYVSAANQPVLLQHIQVEKQTKVNYPLASYKARQQLQAFDLDYVE
jgi:hypothetical protein